MNNPKDWQRVQTEGWYRLPVKHAPEGTPHFDWIAFYFTSAFGSDKWAIHYYAHIEGHELLTRRDLIPSEPDHKRVGDNTTMIMLFQKSPAKLWGLLNSYAEAGFELNLR